MKMRFPNVRFAIKAMSMAPPRVTDHYQCTSHADRDVESREWFKTVPVIYREISMNE